MSRNCPTCGGTKKTQTNCSRCNGSGSAYDSKTKTHSARCSGCAGVGVLNHTCSTCGGSGRAR